MKKYIIPIVLICLACACVKTKPDTGEDIDKSGYTFFGVDIENLSIGGVPVPGSWDDGDQIGVFGSEAGANVPYYLKRGGEGLQAAAFYGGLVKGDVLAYAPFDKTVSATEDAIPCELERVQLFQPGADKTAWFLQYNPRTFAARGEDGILHFRYPMGLMSVRFEFADPIQVQAITIRGENGLSGWLEADWDGDVRPSALSHKEISLNLSGESVSSKTGDGFTEFLFVLPPAVYEAGALTLDVVTPDEEMFLGLQEVEIKRVDNTVFPVTNIVVTSSDLPGFGKVDGYLE